MNWTHVRTIKENLWIVIGCANGARSGAGRKNNNNDEDEINLKHSDVCFSSKFLGQPNWFRPEQKNESFCFAYTNEAISFRIFFRFCSFKGFFLYFFLFFISTQMIVLLSSSSWNLLMLFKKFFQNHWLLLFDDAARSIFDQTETLCVRWVSFGLFSPKSLTSSNSFQRRNGKKNIFVPFLPKCVTTKNVYW